ncbi:MAG: ABC transporter [Calditrichaeota bacterium]|nr:MAG: ABC transporter [Calditrichota bacterium]
MKQINWKVIFSIFKRDIRLYFTNPTGYVFITLFIFLSAAAAFWQERFFLNNLANLDQLNYVFPLLLLFFIPALTMSVWAEERKQGTDELLLTLPATDLEVVIGKFLAVLGIYSASLLISLSHVIVLFWLGSPDLGLMIANYMGYWFIGAAFIAVGMFASLLTANVTIAFILGALFCSVFIFIDDVAGFFGQSLQDLFSHLVVFDYFDDFASGVISLSGIFYFLSLAGVMLFFNILFLSRRHWPQEADGWKMSYHHIIRSVAIVIAVISLNVIIGRLHWRLDITAERLHTLSGETKKLLDEISEERPVFIQAYLSKDPPQQYVQTRANLISFLKEIDAIAGPRVEVAIYDTEPYSDEAREAREKFNILPREVPETGSAGAGVKKVFMGVAFTCGPEEQVIPFFDRGLPTEYELMRSIRVVARTKRKKVGVLVTEAKLFGGFDFQTMQTLPAWEVVDELKKQYEVVRISATSPIKEELDGLVVPMPSTLSQDEMDNLIEYIETGVPTLLLVDPLPAINLGISPSEKAGANRNPFMQQGPPPKPKGNIQEFMRKLGVNWNYRQIVWDAYNPHPDFANIPPEVVFVGRGNENEESFNPEHPATSQLQELVFIFPGYINKASQSTVDFTPLVKTSFVAGVQPYSRMVRRSFLGAQLITRGLPHYPTGTDYILAASIFQREQAKDDTLGTGGNTRIKTIKAIVIADLDFISQQFFEIRKQGLGNLEFDNVHFFLNCMDVLVGDESFIALRNRRVKHRTLTSVEKQVQEYIEQRAREEQQAETEAQLALQEAQKRLEEKVKEVEQRSDLDAQTKQIMAENIRRVEQRRFDALKAKIEAEKEAKIAASKERMEAHIRTIQNGIKTFAVVLPPIPVLVVGIMIFIRRRRREAEGAAAIRRLRS